MVRDFVIVGSRPSLRQIALRLAMPDRFYCSCSAVYFAKRVPGVDQCDEPGAVDMGVYLGRGNVGVAKQRL
jgi:hypothetical protein